MPEKPLSPFDLIPEPAPVHVAPSQLTARPILRPLEHPVVSAPIAQFPGRADHVQSWLMSAGHRMGSISLFTFVGALAAIYARHAAYWSLLLATFISADASLLLGVLASWMRGRRGAVGLIVFSLVMIVVSVALIVMAQRDQLGAIVTRMRGT